MCFSPLFVFSQSDDISKKQAYQLFLKSEAREILKYKKSDFEHVFKIAKCIKKNYDRKFKEMPLFMVKNPNDEYNSAVEDRNMTGYGIGPAAFPNYDDFGNKTKTCNVILTFNVR